MEPVNEPFGNTAKLVEIKAKFQRRSLDESEVQFLLSEIDRLQEIDARGCDMAMSISAENRKLREELAEEREKYKQNLDIAHTANQTLSDQYHKMRDHNNKQAQQIQSIQQERDKLIEVTRHYADRRNHPPFWLHDDGQKARDALKEIGVGEERT